MALGIKTLDEAVRAEGTNGLLGDESGNPSVAEGSIRADLL